MNDSPFSSMRVNLSVIFHTLCSRFLVLLTGLLFVIPFLVFHLTPRSVLHRSWWYHTLLALFYRLIVKASLLDITFEGLENLQHLKPAIIVANHQSSIDIPVVGYVLQGRKHLWMATIHLQKSLLYRVLLPRFVAWVDMSSPIRGMRSLIMAMRSATKTKQDIVIFPEGARQISGQLGSFYQGFALLAQKMKRPVVPIMISGLSKIYPPHSFWIRSFPVTVSVGEPMYMRSDETPKAFTNRIYQWFVEKQ